MNTVHLTVYTVPSWWYQQKQYLGFHCRPRRSHLGQGMWCPWVMIGTHNMTTHRNVRRLYTEGRRVYWLFGWFIPARIACVTSTTHSSFLGKPTRALKNLLVNCLEPNNDCSGVTNGVGPHVCRFFTAHSLVSFSVSSIKISLPSVDPVDWLDNWSYECMATIANCLAWIMFLSLFVGAFGPDSELWNSQCTWYVSMFWMCRCEKDS